MRSLLVLAHYDDEVISCGQYLLDHPGTTIFIACGNDDSRRASFEKVLDYTLSHDMLGNFKPLGLNLNNIPTLANVIRATIKVTNIDRVITHHPFDIHQDHRIVNQATQIALRRLHDVELFYAKNPEGFPFENPKWDTSIEKSQCAKDLIYYYNNIKYPPETDFELYQTVRCFSI